MIRGMRLALFVSLVTALLGGSLGAQEGVLEATSLGGEPLYRPQLGQERTAKLEADLERARAAYDKAGDAPESTIWLGRRTAYLGRYREAIEIYSGGIERFPEDPRLYRHRGHRYITTRQLAKAVADLETAARLISGTDDEVEPDGMPNAAGIPVSTLHTNIWYHLGLARYLQGRFDKALLAYEKCLEASANDDMKVATADWLYMTLRRLGRQEQAARVLAPISADMELMENHAYHRRLLMYKGELSAESLLEVGPVDDPGLAFATQGYGVGNWYLCNGQVAKARHIFARVLAGKSWGAFGYIAAEADLKRLE